MMGSRILGNSPASYAINRIACLARGGTFSKAALARGRSASPNVSRPTPEFEFPRAFPGQRFPAGSKRNSFGLESPSQASRPLVHRRLVGSFGQDAPPPGIGGA